MFLADHTVSTTFPVYFLGCTSQIGPMHFISKKHTLDREPCINVKSINVNNSGRFVRSFVGHSGTHYIRIKIVRETNTVLFLWNTTSISNNVNLWWHLVTGKTLNSLNNGVHKPAISIFFRVAVRTIIIWNVDHCRRQAYNYYDPWTMVVGKCYWLEWDGLWQTGSADELHSPTPSLSPISLITSV